jgi:hypothetical protein
MLIDIIIQVMTFPGGGDTCMIAEGVFAKFYLYRIMAFRPRYKEKVAHLVSDISTVYKFKSD